MSKNGPFFKKTRPQKSTPVLSSFGTFPGPLARVHMGATPPKKRGFPGYPPYPPFFGLFWVFLCFFIKILYFLYKKLYTLVTNNTKSIYFYIKFL